MLSNFARKVATRSCTRNLQSIGYSKIFKTFDYDNWRQMPKYESFPPQKTFSVISCGTAIGQTKIGVDKGPEYIRMSEQFNETLYFYENYWRMVNVNLSFGYEFMKFNNTSCKSAENNLKIRNAHSLCSINKKLFEYNKMATRNSDLIINLLGDHSCGIGTVASSVVTHPDTVVIWIDAHPDINNHITTPTGNGHGVPLGVTSGLCDEFNENYDVFQWIKQKLNLENLIYIGIRDIDEGERQVIHENNITNIPAEHILARGIVACMENENIRSKIAGRNVHISLDVDSLDPTHFPCTGTPVEGGLNVHDISYIINYVRRIANLHKIDVTEFNPLLHPYAANHCMNLLNDFVFRQLFTPLKI